MSKHYLLFKILEKWLQKHTHFLKLFMEMEVYLTCVLVFDSVNSNREGQDLTFN
jgi:hypothetical protein